MALALDTDLEALGAALPGYELGEVLGSGAWGVVTAARHRGLRRDAAIKQLPAELANEPEVRERFRHEARLLATLDHPHIVPIYDFVEQDGVCALVMERLPNGTVWDRFCERGFTQEAACAVAIAAATGLDHAHGQGLLHRDIKPENMMFSAKNVLKVTDFGLAKVVGAAGAGATLAGTVLGTPSYMAPEQARAMELSPATDVYATGCVLYELLAGELPFPEPSDTVVALYQAVHEPPRPLTALAPEVPAPVAEVAMRALRKDPADRPRSAIEFATELSVAASVSYGSDWAERASMALPGARDVVSAGAAIAGKEGARPTTAPRRSSVTRPRNPNQPRSSGPGARRTSGRPAARRGGRARIWATRPRRLAAAVLATIAVAAGVYAGATRLDRPAGDVLGAREVVLAYYKAFNAGDITGAAAYFGLPARTDAPSGEEHVMRTRGEVITTFTRVPCGGRIADVSESGGSVTVRQRLISRPGRVCPRRYRGEAENIVFTIRAGRIVGWHFV